MTESGQRIHFAGAVSPFFRMQLWRGLLTLLTLGFHRFWWRTANRRWLWERTTIDGDPLEYRGRGIEKLIGFLLATLVVVVPLGLLTALLQLAAGSGGGASALTARASAFLSTVLPLVLLFLGGYAIWRARRYLLSRSAWRGIRAGMEGSPWAYARLSFSLFLLQAMTLGFATPYAEARRWNALWNDSRFGTERFAADLDWRPLLRPFVVSVLLVPLVAVAALLATGALLAPVLAGLPQAAEGLDPEQMSKADPALLLFFILFGLLLFLVLPLLVSLAFVPWRSAFLKAAAGATTLGPLRFSFCAGGGDWLRYLAGNAALVIFTLGVGALLLPFRQWRFWTDHLGIDGELDAGRVRQSRLQAPGHGEGLVEVLDIGGI